MSDFEKVLLKDDRLICSPQISYAVMKGAMNHTLVEYNALTGAGDNVFRPSSLTFNIQVPSEQTILDRRVVIRNKFKLTIAKSGLDNSIEENVWNCGNQTGVSNAVSYGADCLNAYPFHQIVNTATITINNTAVSVNTQDILTVLLRLNDDRNLNKFNGTTPIQADSDGNYGSTTQNNGIDKQNSPFSNDISPLDEAYAPRGSFVVKDLNEATIAGGVDTSSTVIEFETFEPLLISPFTFANPQSGNSQGIYGLQNLNFNFTLANPNRLIRSRPQFGANGLCLTATNVANWQLIESALQLVYLTPQPTDALEARNAVPYYELPRYLSNSVAVSPDNAGIWNNPKNPSAKNFSIVMNSIQLNQIPDKLFIFVRPGNNEAYNNNTNCADFYAVINRIEINFNNQAGLLSTMKQNQLYRMARDNGSSQSWTEFSGLVNTSIAKSYALTQDGFKYDDLPTLNLANGLEVGSGSGSILAPTTGSLLILQFGKDIELPDYYAPGSLGSFNIQITLGCSSYNNKDIDEGQSTSYQAVMITMNSGVFITEKGQSAVYTGLLTKEDVLQASAMEPIAVSDYKRMVGGGFWDNIKSVGSKVWNFVKPVLGDVGKFAAQRGADALSQSGNPYANLAGTVLKGVVGRGEMGGAMSAGAMSAGAMSAGAMSAGRRRVAKHLMR